LGEEAAARELTIPGPSRIADDGESSEFVE
jgi:hypothetical protein